MPYSNLRKGRYSETGRIYFVTATTHNREPFFNSFLVARTLVINMQATQFQLDFTFLSWVIMPDHAHWLIQLQGFNSLSKIMNQLKGASAHQINKMLKRNGKFWQVNYYDRGLRKEEDIKEVARYIVANPLRANLVKQLGDYPHWDSIWL